MDALYPPTPSCFHDAMWNAVDRLSDRHVTGRGFRTAVIATVMVVALAGAAYAAAVHFGVLEQLRQRGFEPIRGAEELVTNASGEQAVMVGDVKFELTEQAYDGEQIFLSLKMSSDKFPVHGVFGWSEPGVPGSVLCNVHDVYIDGERVLDFEYGEAKQVDRQSFGMIIVPYKGEGDPEIKLDLSVYHEDTNTWDAGVMAVVASTRDRLDKVLALPEPITMNGVTVSEIEMRYTKFMLYITLKYTIDPELPRFERLRRELMFYELAAPDREPLIKGCAVNLRGEEYIVKGEAVATDEPFEVLTIALRGEDGEVYWEHTVNFVEDTK